MLTRRFFDHERGGYVLLAVLAALAIVVPLANLAVPADTPLHLSTFTVQLLDTKERLRSYVKSELREHGFVGTPMPSYRTTLTTQEIADVVSYLVSLKGRG